MKRLNKKGFTLIELLAVIVILAIVAAVTMAVIVPKLTQAPVDAAKSSVATMKQQITNACTTIGSGVDSYGEFAGTVTVANSGSLSETTCTASAADAAAREACLAACQTGTCTISFTAAQLTNMKVTGEMPENVEVTMNQCSVSSGTFTFSTTEGQFKGIVVTISGNNITTNKD